MRDLETLTQLLCSSERSGPVLLDTERGTERWQLQRQTLAMDGQEQALLVLMPLEQELESESLHAWQQLLQVLTHEIMNSLTPIKIPEPDSAGTLLDEPESAADLRTALDAIARRSEHLSSFVANYRKVSQWPAPTMAPVDLQGLFNRLQQAVGRVWSTRGGEATFELTSPSLRLLADDGQLEQVLLALIQNAEQATADHPTPRLWVQAPPEPRRASADHRSRQRPGSARGPGAADLSAVLQRSRRWAWNRADRRASVDVRHGRPSPSRAAVGARCGLRAELLRRTGRALSASGPHEDRSADSFEGCLVGIRVENRFVDVIRLTIERGSPPCIHKIQSHTHDA